MPADKKLTINDLNQGTITISNLGAAVKGTNGFVGILDIVPPQVCVVGIGAMQEKPEVYYAEDKSPKIGVRKIMPFTIAFDHRALDFGDIAPFINELESIFSSPSVIHTW
jgi:pyruvate dehydrogenase E2 component (dihydrolipoamide acetyltransferase)